MLASVTEVQHAPAHPGNGLLPTRCQPGAHRMLSIAIGRTPQKGSTRLTMSGLSLFGAQEASHYSQLAARNVLLPFFSSGPCPPPIRSRTSTSPLPGQSGPGPGRCRPYPQLNPCAHTITPVPFSPYPLSSPDSHVMGWFTPTPVSLKKLSIWFAIGHRYD